MTDQDLKKSDRDYLQGFAEGLQILLKEVTGDNGWCKSYDPILICDGYIHSYAFDFKDGGRHHPLADYKDIEEIKRCMIKELAEDINNHFNPKED